MNETQRLETLLGGGNGGSVRLPRRDAQELAQKLKVLGNPGAAARLVELLNSPGDVDLNAEEAKSLLDQIRKGASFEDLAKSHGRSPDARTGGDLGWFARGTMPKVFDEACFSLKPGQVSGIVQSSYGYHLFKLLGRRAPKKRGLDEVQKEVIRRAFLEKKAQAERQLLEQVRKSSKVQINEAALQLLR